jgi:hypothetical protein
VEVSQVAASNRLLSGRSSTRARRVVAVDEVVMVRPSDGVILA